MKIDRNTNYWTKGSTKEQREEFIKLVLRNEPKGWEDESITNFIFDYDEDDCIYFDSGEWAWDSQVHPEDTTDVNIKFLRRKMSRCTLFHEPTLQYVYCSAWTGDCDCIICNNRV